MAARPPVVVLLPWPSTLSHPHQSPSHVREGKRVLGTYLPSQPTDDIVCVCVCCGLLCALSDVAQPPSSRCGPPDSPALVQQRHHDHVRSGWLCLLQPVHPLLALLLQVTEKTYTPDPCPVPAPPCSPSPSPVHDQVASDLPCYIMGWSRLSGTLALPLSLVVGVVGRFLYHVSTSCRPCPSGFPWHAMRASVRPVGR